MMTSAIDTSARSLTSAHHVEMRDITRRFGGFVANDHVDFELRPGEVHALLGENGAGKTTLLRILSGYLRRDAGRILVDGTETEIPDPRTALKLGIGMVHQHTVLVPQLSVAENILLGRQPRWTARYSPKKLEDEVRQVCEDFGARLDPRSLIENLSADEVQQVEIVRLLHRRVTTLVLDEPTAILGRAYVDRLFENLAQLRDRQHSIVIITHKLREVMAIADRVTVMRAGRVTARLDRADFDEEVLATALVGDAVPTSRGSVAKGVPRSSDVRWASKDITIIGDRGEVAVEQVTLAIHAGEILGVAGVEGNGQRELVETLSGLRPMAAGTVEVDGRHLRRVTPQALDRAGAAVISENRLRWDLVGDLTVAENLMLANVVAADRRFSRGGILRLREMTRAAKDQLVRFDVRPADPAKGAARLSGGNQQKMVLAREIDHDPRFVIAAHPSRGLDIGATRFVHSKLQELRDHGSAVLLVSADLDELLALSDRIVVMYHGRIVYECVADAKELPVIGRAMIGING